MYPKLRDQLWRLAAPERPRGVASDAERAPSLAEAGRIRLLTFNIQVGIATAAYRHYVTRSWQHFLPHSRRRENLDRIAELLCDYDVVALQECDGGSLRSGFVNQVQYLASQGGFPYWRQQLNRNLGRIAQHSNGILSRYQPLWVEEHRLPALLPGRGAMMAFYGNPDDPLVLVLMHLSLGKGAQNRQLDYIRKLIAPYQHVVLMGDMNAHAEQLLTHSPLRSADLIPLPDSAMSFPSWRPEKALDHILVSPTLDVHDTRVVDYPVSDHLPVSMEIEVPGLS
ncbi:endonuclease/exonuclease/phosphatase family protein [Halomonadaceae bacterium KBTZ08]